MNPSLPMNPGPGSRRGEVDGKLLRVRDALARRGAAACALSARHNFAWLTDGGDNHVVSADQGGVATILVTPRSAVVLTTNIEAPRITAEELEGLDLEVIALPWWDAGALDREILGRAGGPVLGDEALEADLVPLRSCLTAPEQERLAALGADAGRAMTAVFRGARPGDVEAELAQRLTVLLARDGISAPVLLSASDERIVRFRHPIPKPRPVEHSFMLVAVVERGGLHAALTRIGWLAGRPDADTLHRYAACARVDAAMRAATMPGASLAGVLDRARDAYREVGFPDEWRLHHQGGPIAYRPREAIAVPGSPLRIEAGMAFAWNPSIAGVKLEDTFVLTADGERRIVTRDPEWPAEPDGTPSIWVAAA